MKKKHPFVFLFIIVILPIDLSIYPCICILIFSHFCGFLETKLPQSTLHEFLKNQAIVIPSRLPAECPFRQHWHRVQLRS